MKILWATGVTFGETIHQWGQLGTAASLKKNGFEIDFISPSPSPAGKSILEEFGFGQIPLRKSKIPGTFFLSLNKQISSILQTKIDLEEYDAIMSEWQTSSGVMSACKKIRKIGKRFPPWIFEDRSPPALTSVLSHFQWIQYRFSWKYAANYADSVEVLVPGLEKFVRKKYGFDKGIIHCPSGVDLDRFFPSVPKEDNKRMSILHHGSLNEGRGLKRIVQLGLDLQSSERDVEVTVFGAGPLAGFFEEAARKYEWLNFLGEIPFEKVPSEIRRHDIGILPLPKKLPWDVGSPLKAMEYAASGLSVFATDVDGSIPLMSYDWFFCAPSDDPIEFWLKSFDDVSVNREKLSLRAREDSENDLSWDNATKELVREFERIIQLRKLG